MQRLWEHRYIAADTLRETPGGVCEALLGNRPRVSGWRQSGLEDPGMLRKGAWEWGSCEAVLSFLKGDRRLVNCF